MSRNEDSYWYSFDATSHIPDINTFQSWRATRTNPAKNHFPTVGPQRRGQGVSRRPTKGIGVRWQHHALSLTESWAK